jgi:hypothetical protein
MPTRLLEHVSVWIDELAATTTEAFPHAMQWALCLGLPLRVVVTAARPAPSRHADGNGAGKAAACRRLTETMQAWSAACSAKGIVLETSLWVGGTEVGLARCLRPCGLCVVAARQYERFRQDLLARGSHTPAAALLLCPPREPHLRRVAILYEHMNPNAAYLETALHVCQALAVRPLIVTIARTARDSGLKRSHADGVCASLDVAADFDGIVSSEPRNMLGRLLEAQRCSHLVIERADGAAVWPRLHGDWLAPWRGLSDALGILALPETTALDVPLRRPAVCTAVH